MTKKLRSLKKHWQKPRGLILAATAVIIAIVGLVAITIFSSMLAKITATADFGYAAYYAARTCLYQADNLDMSAISTGVGCTVGKAINFADSTELSTVCNDVGEANTILTLGSYCSCTTQILQTNANSYDIAAVGRCNASGVRTDDEGSYTVTINKAINNCESCAQFCSGGQLAQGASCVTSCGKNCNSCCHTGASSPACDGTPPVCQNP